MDKAIRRAQVKLLSVFAGVSGTFALSGGTALELFYLKHRFSRDLDFFSSRYDLKEIDRIVSAISRAGEAPVVFENEFSMAGRARVRFYTMKVKGCGYPLKIDFVEDVLQDKPRIENFNGIPVYGVRDIYYQKIVAVTGANLVSDSIGREITTGRKEARDIVDIYYLSKKICPMHAFMKNLGPAQKRGIVYWYRTYSRQDVKMDALDLDIYDKSFSASKMIKYLDEEVKKYVSREV